MSNDNQQKECSQQEQRKQDPLERFLEDWAAAREGQDPNAPFCTVATVTKDGFPRVRIVGLRQVNADGEGSILLFINDTSPKFDELQSTNKFEILTFWTRPNMIQYRIRGTQWSRLNEKEMEELWHKKPKTSQLLDYYYTHYQPQSSTLPNGRTDFVETMQKLQEEFASKQVPFQSIATGLILEPDEIEEWRGSTTDRLHERYLYKKKTGDGDAASSSWQRETLVP